MRGGNAGNQRRTIFPGGAGGQGISRTHEDETAAFQPDWPGEAEDAGIRIKRKDGDLVRIDLKGFMDLLNDGFGPPFATWATAEMALPPAIGKNPVFSCPKV